MIAWIMTVVLAALVARIVYLEKKGSRRNVEALAKTNAQIASIMKNATVQYRTKYGRDPAELHTTLQFKVQPTKTASR